MILDIFTGGPVETNAYLVSCPKTLKAFVVDVPLNTSDKILKKIQERNFSLDRILLTHSHWDHIGDVAVLKRATGALVSIHPLDGDNLRNPGADHLPLFVPIEGVEPDMLIKEGDRFFVGSIQVQVMTTPGHTLGGVCFYLPQEGVLFSGDTLFKNSMGRIDFPLSCPESMWASLKRLAALPPSTKVYPGHGPSTTIAKESWLERAEEKFS